MRDDTAEIAVAAKWNPFSASFWADLLRIRRISGTIREQVMDRGEADPICLDDEKLSNTFVLKSA